MRIWHPVPYREQSAAEEMANSISHGLGLLAALAGTPMLIHHAQQQQSIPFLVGSGVFAATIIFLYLTSTIYHALPVGRTKHIFRLIEHSAIFFLIAGTYTPFTLGILDGVWGWSLFGIIWGLAIVGVALKLHYQASRPMLFTGLYLLMGWVILIAIDPLLNRVPQQGLLLLLAGGLSYTAGVAFFILDSRLKYSHLIWHLCVITGTAFHYFTVLWYAA
ncbi:PAQR family membrane homeostasis protein TrhA [Porticoccus sp.]